MVKAMEAVISNTMGVNQAAASYNVPPTMLKNKISGSFKHGTKPGPHSYLTPEEESELVDFLVNNCKMGNGKTKQEVVQRLVEKKRGKENLNVQWRGVEVQICKETSRVVSTISRSLFILSI